MEEDKEEFCEDCGGRLDEEGDGYVCCYYTQDECETCGGRTCDQSC